MKQKTHFFRFFKKVFFLKFALMGVLFFQEKSILAEPVVYGVDLHLTDWTRRYPSASNETAIEDETRPGHYLIQLHLNPSDPPNPDEARQTIYVAKPNIPVEPGRKYTVSTRCRTDIADTGVARVVCYFLKDKTVLKDENAKVYLSKLSGLTDWTEITGTVEVPQEANGMLLQLVLTGMDGTAWFDEVIITEEPTDFAGYQVPNGPFLFGTPEQWKKAREKVKQFPWATKIQESILQTADPWAKKSQKELTSLIPPPHSYYLYGISKPLDPKTGESLKWCGWSNPFFIQNTTGTRYPNEEYPDSGTGFINADKQPFYFVAYANGERLRSLEQSILPALCTAYALTEDKKYAQAALWLLDAIATVYPTADSGPLDYPGIEPGQPGGGRLQRPYYQAAGALMRYGYCYDILSSFPEIDSPSPTAPTQTARENILMNLIGNGGAYCYSKSRQDKNLNNGTLDYNRGVLVAGAFLGLPSYLEHATYGTNSIVAAISNAIDPQGRYFETSSNYSAHTTDLLVTTAHLLTGIQRGLSEFPLSLFDDERLATFCLEDFSKLQIAGRLPLYGDAGPDRTVLADNKWFNPLTYRNSLMFLTFSNNPKIQQKAARLLHYLEQKELSEKNHQQLAAYTGTRELLLLFKDPHQEFSNIEFSPPETNSLFSDAGLALLRSRHPADERAALLRLGPTRNHGQLDELNLQLYAFGREFSADPGHAKAHLRFGFTRTTVAHNTVVVNQQNQLRTPSAGGELISWTPGNGFSSMEANNLECYKSLDIQQYQRRVAQVDCDSVYYLIDVFRVQGGTEYDYSFHAIHEGKITPPKEPESGLESPSTQAGSILSSTTRHGPDLLPDGKLKGFPDKPFYWTPAGQGYAFLGEPVFYQPGKQIHLEWRAQDATGHRLIWQHFPPAGSKIVLAKMHAPTTVPLSLEYALSRVTAKPEDKIRFVSLIRPQSAAETHHWSSQELEVVNPPNSDAVGLEIFVKDTNNLQVAHHLFASSTQNNDTIEFKNGFSLQAREGFISLDSEGVPQRISVSDGKLTFADFHLETIAVTAQKILEIRNHPLQLRVEGTSDDWENAKGCAIQLEAPGYLKPLVYQILDVEWNSKNEIWLTLDADSNLQSTFFVSGVNETALHTVSQFPRVQPITGNYDSETGLPLAKAQRGSGYTGGFNGFTIASQDAVPFARIITLEDDRSTLRIQKLENATFFPAVSDQLQILAPVAGDHVKLLSWAQATRSADGSWTVIGPGVLKQ